MFNDIWYAMSHSKEIITIMDRRKVQLHDQKCIDDELKNKCHECSDIVNRLLYYDRHMNRSVTDSTNVHHYILSIQKSYEGVQEHHNKLFKVFSSENPCLNLNIYLDELTNK